MMDFCANVFDPSVGAENLMAVRERYDKEYVTFHGPVLGDTTIKELTEGDEEASRVISKLNALKILRTETDYSDLEREGLNNYKAVIDRGNLGLIKVA